VSDRALFPRRSARLLLGLAAVSLGLTFFALVFVAPADPPAAGADSYSRSALGHRALVELLEQRVPVLVARAGAVAQGSPDRPLLLLEPGPQTEQQLEDVVALAVREEVPVVVVLPKWQGIPDEKNPQWVGEVHLLPLPQVQALLASAMGTDETAEVVRPESDLGPWSWNLPGDPVAPALPRPQLLVAAEGYLEPLLTTDHGILVGRVPDLDLYLVADPDFLNTSGLERPGNAVLAQRLLLDELAPAALVVDETIHGYQLASSLWRALLEPPLVFLTLQAAALGTLVLWAGAGRLGRPLAPPPRVAPGKETLLDNTARLLVQSGHHGYSLERYLRGVVDRTADRLGVPPGGLRARVKLLAAIGRRRGVELDLDRLARKASAQGGGRADRRRVLELARALSTWRKEILDGDRARPRAS
jgi:hypothetical protein